MRYFIIVSMQLVLLNCFKTPDYKNQDYSNSWEQSAGDSNEIIKNKTKKPTFRLSFESSSIDMVSSKKKIKGDACDSNENCHILEKDDDDRATTTLVNYPFSVSIQKKGAHYTTGALIDKKWILSTAGDFYNVRESIKLFRVRLGSVDCKKGGIVVPLKRFEIHPSYEHGQPNYDLGLLRMAHSVDFSDVIKPIQVSKINSKVISAKFMTTYWARLIVGDKVLPTTANERVKPNSMRVSTQRLIPRDKCVDHMPNVTLAKSTLCLKPFQSHHSICMPDSGAPVIAEDGLWGITSGWVSENCHTHPSPTMFTRISMPVMRAWLDAQMD